MNKMLIGGWLVLALATLLGLILSGNIVLTALCAWAGGLMTEDVYIELKRELRIRRALK